VDAARQFLLGVAAPHTFALLYDNGHLNARARALEACYVASGAARGLEPVGDMSVLELVHAVAYISAPSPPAAPQPNLLQIAHVVSAAAEKCGFGSLPPANGEKLLAGVVFEERAVIQGGLGSFVTSKQLERLQQQHSSAFAVIKSFFPLAPLDAINGRRLHIAFASKDLGFSSVGQLVRRCTCTTRAALFHAFPCRSMGLLRHCRCVAA
jgi:hypothetical protein